MSLFPFMGDTPREQQVRAKTIPREYAWDFEIGDFVRVNGKFVIVEGLEAIKVWIYKALNTPRFRHMAYSWNYGHELENLIGSTYSPKASLSEAKRYIGEALRVNPHIRGIRDLKLTFSNSVLDGSFVVDTEFGEVTIDV